MQKRRCRTVQPTLSQQESISISMVGSWKTPILVFIVVACILLSPSPLNDKNLFATASAVHTTTFHCLEKSSQSFRNRRSTGAASFVTSDDGDGLHFLYSTSKQTMNGRGNDAAVLVQRSIGNTLVRGALLRIASDFSGGTPLENIKTRVTVTNDNMIAAIQKLVREGGIPALWTGTSSRTIEGAFVGAMFMLGSTLTKRQLLVWGTSRTTAALAGGLVGGVAQAIVMTPAGLIFTALNNNSQKSSKSTSSTQKSENAIQIVRRVIQENGVWGMYAGMKPMCIRQATNWASRAGFTEIARTSLQLSQYGLIGEIVAGTIGGVGSCWNTPIETIRVYMQRDVSQGIEVKSMAQYWDAIVDESGYPGLFRGVTPRAIQAIWQTVFLVVVPNLMGL
jgi:hypothetical protein